jgi:ribosomal protein L40E
MVKQKIEAAMNRLYNRVFICMKCNAKLRSDIQRVKAKKVKCRKCGSKALRQKSREIKA